ncbi:MAG TPA: alkene reductase [Phenylobacterium sp.]
MSNSLEIDDHMGSKLFTPVSMGALQLRNRIVMAPMTRSRAGLEDGVPREFVPLYYAQRATAGLIISEGVSPSPIGRGYLMTPGIYSDAQVARWREVTDAVHREGGLMAIQLMHTGRISNPGALPDDADPVAPSAIKAEGWSFSVSGEHGYRVPRALTTVEVEQTIADYATAARRAIEAGFDSVELHAATGYLPMQFLSSKTNHRDDRYGGSIENRARFVVETLQAIADVVGADRVGVKLSPEFTFNDVSDDTPQETYRNLVETIAPMGLGYLHVAQPAVEFDYHAMLRPLFPGAYLYGAGLNKEKAEGLLQSGAADAAAFGALFVANPDLPQRFKQDAVLASPDPKTLYGGAAEGYIDYPALDAA